MPRRQITRRGRTAPSRQEPTNQQGGESTVAEPPSAHAPADLVEEPAQEPAEAPVEEPLDVEPATEPSLHHNRNSHPPIEPAETSERYTWIGPDTDGPFTTLPRLPSPGRVAARMSDPCGWVDSWLIYRS